MLQTLKRTLVSNGITRRLLFNRVTGGFGEYVEAARKHARYAGYRDRYDIDPEFDFLGPGTLLYGRGSISLAKDSYIGRHSRIQSRAGQSVRVGENTAVSYYVHVFTQNRVADQDMSEHLNRNEHLAASRGDVTIGDDCWIGAMAFVTEGCDIGENTVVGANSVVTRDLPPFCVAAGTPARVRKFKSCLDEPEARELAADHRDVLAPELRRALRDTD